MEKSLLTEEWLLTSFAKKGLEVLVHFNQIDFLIRNKPVWATIVPKNLKTEHNEISFFIFLF